MNIPWRVAAGSKYQSEFPEKMCSEFSEPTTSTSTSRGPCRRLRRDGEGQSPVDRRRGPLSGECAERAQAVCIGEVSLVREEERVARGRIARGEIQARKGRRGPGRRHRLAPEKRRHLLRCPAGWRQAPSRILRVWVFRSRWSQANTTSLLLAKRIGPSDARDLGGRDFSESANNRRLEPQVRSTF